MKCVLLSNKSSANHILALRPEVFLTDEPCSARPISILTIEELIKKLREQYTIVIVADKTVFMYLGEVIEKDDTTSIFKNPQKEYIP